MKSKEARMMRWRLRLKLAAVVFLGAAALLLTPAQPASASSCLQLPVCKGTYTASGGCCNLFWKTGTDSNGLCRYRQFGRYC